MLQSVFFLIHFFSALLQKGRRESPLERGARNTVGIYCFVGGRDRRPAQAVLAPSNSVRAALFSVTANAGLMRLLISQGKTAHRAVLKIPCSSLDFRII